MEERKEGREREMKREGYKGNGRERRKEVNGDTVEERQTEQKKASGRWKVVTKEIRDARRKREK